jgi:CubicO group peptidase (beta-lactamase class C family)
MKNSFCRCILFWGFMVFCPLLILAQADPNTKLKEDLDRYLREVIKKIDIPGLTIAITKDGEVSYSAAFGVRNIDTEEPMKVDYLFHMASVSKPFVATAIMQLVEQGKMDLDARVTDYLPYFELKDERYKTITIQQMLNHTSGMPDVQDYEWDKPQTDEGAAERYVRSLTGETMLFDPGAGWRYSNMAFDAMGDVIAKVSGMSFEAYVKQHILDPLGMTHSTFLYPETPQSLRTTPHVWKVGPIVSEVYPYNRRHAPSSTLNSSVLEMTRWAMANLNHGALDGKRILQEESYDLLWQPSHQLEGEPPVGLSWFLGTYRDAKIVAHGGGDTGYRSNITLLPDQNTGLIIASNYDFTPMGAIRNGVLDILLGFEPAMPAQPIAVPFAETYLNEGMEAAQSLYQQLKKESPEDYEFGDGQLNRLGYFFLQEGQADKAIQIFRFNIELYPKVANCYDSLGEAYMIAGKKELAIQYYEKALEVDPNFENARKILEELKN